MATMISLTCITIFTPGTAFAQSHDVFQKLENVFLGNASASHIRRLVVEAAHRYDMPQQSSSYYEIGDVLVALRTGMNGVTEMQVLQCALVLGSPVYKQQSLDFRDAAAICAATLASG
ncbi:hypothetical protein [Roseitalea porphyridii]|uniref:Uncharacterized protein n=1 Tax=Roseitalea porphyridii TaxID=1852022 RepID=A0A4P6UYP5_9HYPH|nr:hypothetical protein [Roseitalea porphyridii]QBK30142.1 hypothetical protein E0E05_05735 [Roseitalea porphyridii]